jgi:ATP-dependent helicase/nuclease subunit A
LDGAVITTFHGFCSRLLREFPVEAMIDPQFTLMDETQSAMLIESVVEESLTEFINSGHEVITTLVVGAGRTAVAHAIVRIYKSMRNQGLSLAQVEDVTNKSHGSEEVYSQLFQQADALMNEFISRPGLPPGAEKRRQEAAFLWPEFRDLVGAIPDLPTLADYCAAFDSLRANVRPDKKGNLATLAGALDDILWGAEKKTRFGRLPKICFDYHARELAREIISVLRKVELRLEENKRALAALDFDDLILRVLQLFDDRPDVVDRIAVRYHYFLVDEFQDTNGQQRELMRRLALAPALRANLFIVGDRKQSIYGFRGADVDVFRAMTEEIGGIGGLMQALSTNFRSRRPLIGFFNHLFEHAFKTTGEQSDEDLHELGYVEHESSEAHRDADDDAPIVELLIDIREKSENASEDGVQATETSRERDAKQIASRILSLVDDTGQVKYRDIVLLFRAMSNVAEYESVFRRLGIPYNTVQGKGFYAREEIRDLLQLLSFLDNTTDEIALAAVLRSPLCGLSDEVLFALRCAPTIEKGRARGTQKHKDGVRNLLDALRGYDSISFLNEDERPALQRTRGFLFSLIEKRNRLPVSDLLRFAVDESEFLPIVAANFDGAQRLANIWKLFELAERFEKSGAHMIRDFVRFVEDFERTGGRESEGQIDETADTVLFMSIHQSKGQEFPVVIIPDLTRRLRPRQSDWFMLDRHRGLTVKVPDGSGGMISGLALEAFRERDALRNLYESMRLLYVAATRAKDRLILSGASAKQIKLDGKSDSWLKWVMTALELDEEVAGGRLEIGDDVHVNVFLNLADEMERHRGKAEVEEVPTRELFLESESIAFEFPLLKPLSPEREPLEAGSETTSTNDIDLRLRRALHRFSVTQLINFQRCARQYYFDRILHTPSLDELDAWNSAESPEPPANLTATLRGSVVHRFCEIYESGMDVTECLARSFDSVLAMRSADVGERIDEIQTEDAIRDLLPLANNYLNSDVFRRIDEARSTVGTELPAELFSERQFVLRRAVGSLSGTIDKMIVTPVPGSGGLNVEIIDFKTDRFPKRKPLTSRRTKKRDAGPALLEIGSATDKEISINDQVLEAMFDYQLQMQAYALAVRELVPNVNELRVTIHFLGPNIEKSLSADALSMEVSAKAVDNAMSRLLSSGPENYPTRPADHCRFCNFRDICADGRNWIRTQIAAAI